MLTCPLTLRLMWAPPASAGFLSSSPAPDIVDEGSERSGGGGSWGKVPGETIDRSEAADGAVLWWWWGCDAMRRRTRGLL